MRSHCTIDHIANNNEFVWALRMRIEVSCRFYPFSNRYFQLLWSTALVVVFLEELVSLFPRLRFPLGSKFSRIHFFNGSSNQPDAHTTRDVFISCTGPPGHRFAAIRDGSHKPAIVSIPKSVAVLFSSPFHICLGRRSFYTKLESQISNEWPFSPICEYSRAERLNTNYSH